MSNKAFSYIVKLISAREYSEHKLRTKLKEKKFPANEIDDALAEIKERGYLREDVYSDARIRGFMNKGYSPSYIRQKMQQEHVTVSEELIRDIFEEHNVTEEEQIEQLISKKLRNIPDDKEEAYKEQQKAVRYAFSKGHSPSMVFKMVKAKFKEIQLENSNDLF